MYGVIVHGVRTDKESIDTDNQDRAIEKIESENAVLHEGAKVAYVGWLTKEGRKKAASSLVVEFTTKYHANRVIREGLVLNAIHHDCVLYDRSYRLKQCYCCHEYGHIGPQCDAEERCGYCAGVHNSKECIAGDADLKPTPKCVLCKGQHTAWSNVCPWRWRAQVRVEILPYLIVVMALNDNQPGFQNVYCSRDSRSLKQQGRKAHLCYRPIINCFFSIQ